MKKTRENCDYLPGLALPRSVQITPDLDDCAGVNLFVLVTPSIAFREIAIRLQKAVGNTDAILLSSQRG